MKQSSGTQWKLSDGRSDTVIPTLWKKAAMAAFGIRIGEAEMGLKKLAAKVEDYRVRLESGKTSKIKPSHVEKVLQKLRAKAADLEAEIAAAPSVEKKTRIEGKLAIAQTHIARAEWLLKELA